VAATKKIQFLFQFLTMLGPLSLQTWRCYNQGHPEDIIDSSLGDNLDEDEACRFLKIGLLCTQQVTKQRLGMSTVVAMLRNDADVGAEKISNPDLVSDFRDQFM
jgi:hypothetical protein